MWNCPYIIMSFFLARRRVFSGLKGVKVVQMVIPSRWNSCPVDPRQVEKVTVKLHAGHSAADGNCAVTSEVNRPAISPIVTVAAARRPPPQLEKLGHPRLQDGQKIIPS